MKQFLFEMTNNFNKIHRKKKHVRSNLFNKFYNPISE